MRVLTAEMIPADPMIDAGVSAPSKSNASDATEYTVRNHETTSNEF